jgi:hypothetical protein
MRSLKIARPLLASVANFVLFAMALFSYVLRRAFGRYLESKLMPFQDHRHPDVQGLVPAVVLLRTDPR